MEPSEPTKKKRKKKRRVVLDAYRADVSHALARVLGLAALLVVIGSFTSGSALVVARLEGMPVVLGARATMIEGAVPMVRAASTERSGLPTWLGVIGLLFVAGGAATAILGLRHVLREERYLLLRKDGALFVRGKDKSLVRWSDVEDVIHEDGQLVFVRHDGSALFIDESWGGVSLPELAKRAAQLRRRALFGLIR